MTSCMPAPSAGGGTWRVVLRFCAELLSELAHDALSASRLLSVGIFLPTSTPQLLHSLSSPPPPTKPESAAPGREIHRRLRHRSLHHPPLISKPCSPRGCAPPTGSDAALHTPRRRPILLRHSHFSPFHLTKSNAHATRASFPIPHGLPTLLSCPPHQSDLHRK
jgi:hypothetical protein